MHLNPAERSDLRTALEQLIEVQKARMGAYPHGVDAHVAAARVVLRRREALLDKLR